MEYRIKSKRYLDEYGTPGETNYYIEYKKPFLFFWERWAIVRHETCGAIGCGTTTTYFESLEKAEGFAIKHLCNGRVYDGHEEEIVKQGKC